MNSTCIHTRTRCIGDYHTLHLKVAACFSIFTACSLGVCFPILGSRIVRSFNTNSTLFVLLKAFSSGVVLATGFVHILPDAFDALASSHLHENSWGKFPLAGFTSMVSALITLLLDIIGTSFYKAKRDVRCETDRFESPELVRYTVVAQVMEFGMVAHSLIIGITLGSNQRPCTIKSLVVALTFHQLFEGLALGGCLSQAAFHGRSVWLMCFVFSITTPTGIGIGLGVSSVYDNNSARALMVEGLLDSVSAGILVYMALVDLIATDFLGKQDEQSLTLQLAGYSCIMCGACTMSFIALWA